MKNYFIKLCLMLISMSAWSACEIIKVAGDFNWPPYITKKNNKVAGATVEILEVIFKELDLPIKYVGISKNNSIDNNLKWQDIDLYINSYIYPSSEKLLNFIRPAVTFDPITIVTRKGELLDLENWEILIGKRGFATRNFKFTKEFTNFKNNYLYIQTKDNLKNILESLVTKEIDYVIGSYNQLSYALHHSKYSNKLIIRDELQMMAEVFIAFINTSSCQIYCPYISKRIKEMNEESYTNNLIQSFLE